MKLSFYNSSFFDFLFVFLVALIVSLPSGFIFGFPIKHLAFLLIFFIYFSTGLKNINFFVCFLSFFLIFVLPFLFSGVIDFGGWALREFQLLLTPFVLAALFVSYFGFRSLYFLIVILFFSLIIIFALKLFFLAIVFLGHETLTSAVELHEYIFSSTFVSLQIYPGLIRIFGPYDAFVAFTPLLLASILSIKPAQLSLKSIIFLIFISLLIVFISYSRFLWFVYSCGLLVLFFYIPGRFNKFLIVFFVFFAFLLMFTFGFDFFTERFSSKNNTSSDSIRIDQFYCLYDLWLQRPFLGWGLGAYSDSCIRSVTEPYSYELQLFSFLPKMGITFILVSLCYFAYAGFQLLLGRFVFGALLLMVYLTGMTNPFLLNTGFVPVYIFILILAFSKKFINFQVRE